MKFLCKSLLFGSCFLSVFCSWAIPRLMLRQDNSSQPLIYSKNVSHTVFCLQHGSENLLLGQLNSVLELNDGGVVENFTLTDNGDDFCDGSSCEIVITVIEEFQDWLFICGTNGRQPTCWKLDPRKNNRSLVVVESIDGSGISPYKYSQNSLSLVVDGDLYAAAPLYLDGTSLHFRRQAGSQNKLWMYDPWITEPTFISAFVASRPEDPLNEKIYVLFREKNSDSSPEADPWISRVARVCKIDKGGPKRFFQNIWTSFLKARLVCAIPGESLYFNRLQDIFVLHSDNWKESLVYALFSSSWNATAVCIYSLAELDDIFEKSSFKGYNEDIPNPRPGTCVGDSRSLPTPTIRIVRNHPEMTDWVHPIQKHAPFYISNNNYTKIAVDRVQASDEKMYNVLLLATDTGTIHKILEHDSKAFIISETSLCSGAAPVLSMKLHSEKRKLFVGYPGQMSVLDLQACQDYNTSCEDCVLARDPYCAWTENGCTSQIKGGIQNIATGEPHICSINSALKRLKRDVPSSVSTPPIVHTVPKGFPFYLSCPIDSHHATYSWEHRGESEPCQRTQSDCLYLIKSVSAHDYGMYSCVSRERNYSKMVKVYQLNGPSEPRTLNRAFKLTAEKEWLLAVFTALLFREH
ncbi:semaphorin-7A [Pangasianodon hypophthalmus]|uniref:semaphorin-7A n=1 Tax=Pangasianodon hypophthalmus TaxID=310915 RepID=UPI0023083084|nr:semaphorin-7A [Pangasianodon hypophthalmus]